jgi:predicted TIM-barrel fold metal-dependent hydrolase
VLRQFNLTFDAFLYHPQIAELTDLARAFPEQPIVLDHMGGIVQIGPYAGRGQEIFDGWRRAICELATCPNVFIKLGGFGMKIGGFPFHDKPPKPASSTEIAAAWLPYVEACIDAFGPRRAMFESNFPVDKHMCSYAVLWNTCKRLAAGASPADKAALFRDTAMRFYGLS